MARSTSGSSSTISNAGFATQHQDNYLTGPMITVSFQSATARSMGAAHLTVNTLRAARCNIQLRHFAATLFRRLHQTAKGLMPLYRRPAHSLREGSSL